MYTHCVQLGVYDMSRSECPWQAILFLSWLHPPNIVAWDTDIAISGMCLQVFTPISHDGTFEKDAPRIGILWMGGGYNVIVMLLGLLTEEKVRALV